MFNGKLRKQDNFCEIQNRDPRDACGYICIFATASPASARCRNFYDLCQFAKAWTIRHRSWGPAGVINDGVRRNDGHVVWDGLNQCHGQPVKIADDRW